MHRLDRLARDLVLQEQLLAELHRRGKELASVDRTEHDSLAHSPDDPTRALVRRMLGSIAQYEREVIRLRLMAGRTRKQLEVFMRYHHEQGLSARRVGLDELFAPSTAEISKI